MGSRASRAGTARPGAHIFSVAQHTLLVGRVARARGPPRPPARLAILLHDAPEYVIGDMISPFKAVIGDAYKAVEARLLAAIHMRFGLPPRPPARSSADQDRRPRRGLSRSDQARGLRATRGAALFRAAAGLPPAIERDYLTPWPAGTAEKRYLERFRRSP